MAENELKWYDILEVLFGTILSFADPVTDILTLVEFYPRKSQDVVRCGACIHYFAKFVFSFR